MVTFVLVIALLIIVIWGVFIGKKVRLAEYSSNRSHGNTKDIFFTLMGSLVGGYMFFGLTAISYEVGTVAMAIGIGYGIGLLILAFSVPKIKSEMNRYDCDTMDDFIGAKFGKKVQAIVSITNFIFFLAVVGAQFIAMTSYLSVVAPQISNWLPLLAALVVIFYTSFAGYKGVILTDFPQFIVLAFSAGILLITLISNTSWTTVKTISSSHFVPTGYGMVFLIGALLLFPLTLLVRSDLWQRISFSSSPKNAKNAFLLTIPCLLIFYAIFTGIGIIARAELGLGVRPESSGLAFFTKILSDPTNPTFIPDILLSIVSIGIFAALLSTADTNLNIGSVALTKLLYLKKWKSFNLTIKFNDRFRGNIKVEEKYLIKRIRMVAAILGICAWIFGLIYPNIVNIMVACAAILMVFLPSVIGSLFMNHTNSLASFVSILGGLFSFVISIVLLSNYKSAFAPAAVIAVVIYILFLKIPRRMEKT